MFQLKKGGKCLAAVRVTEGLPSHLTMANCGGNNSGIYGGNVTAAGGIDGDSNPATLWTLGHIRGKSTIENTHYTSATAPSGVCVHIGENHMCVLPTSP
jgi:hypothetical protein